LAEPSIRLPQQLRQFGDIRPQTPLFSYRLRRRSGLHTFVETVAKPLKIIDSPKLGRSSSVA
jgi:hypothetical protein